LASTGIRIGALAPLKLSHVKKIKEENVYKFTIYQNTKEEYITFCTPECASYIDQYFEFRIRCGEKLLPNSQFIREQFDVNDFEQVKKHGRKITQGTLSNMLRSMVIRIGHREVNHQWSGREHQSH